MKFKVRLRLRFHLLVFRLFFAAIDTHNIQLCRRGQLFSYIT